MAYENQCDAAGFRCTPLLRFSNPIQTYLGSPPALSKSARKYGLTIDRREADTLERVLSACKSTEMIVQSCGQQNGIEFPFSTLRPALVQGGRTAASEVVDRKTLKAFVLSA